MLHASRIQYAVRTPCRTNSRIPIFRFVRLDHSNVSSELENWAQGVARVASCGTPLGDYSSCSHGLRCLSVSFPQLGSSPTNRQDRTMRSPIVYGIWSQRSHCLRDATDDHYCVSYCGLSLSCGRT